MTTINFNCNLKYEENKNQLKHGLWMAYQTCWREEGPHVQEGFHPLTSVYHPHPGTDLLLFLFSWAKEREVRKSAMGTAEMEQL